MKFTYLAVAALITAFGSGVQAQGTNTKSAPAEFPPASYKATQYVDSRGCVYIRAGVNGNTTWIARLTRQRRHICGMEPTRVAGATPTPRPTPRAASRVEQITLDTPVEVDLPEPDVRTASATLLPRRVPRRVQVDPVAPKPAPARVRQSEAAPQSTVTRQAAAPVRRATKAPTPTVANAVLGEAVPQAPARTAAIRGPLWQKHRRKDGAPAPMTAAVRAACSGNPVLSSTYVDSGRNIAVRCGKASARVAFAAAAEAPAKRVGPVRSVRVAGDPVASTSLAGKTRVVPLHVYRARAARKDYPVPKGYRLAWDDDRLNPYRAEGTLSGRDRMNLVWSSTVPRRLIDRTTGRDVTAKVALVYPFTDFVAQERQLGSVTLMTRNGALVKRIKPLPGAPSAKELQDNPNQVVASAAPAAVAKQVVSTRSKAPVKRHAKAARAVATAPKRVVKRKAHQPSAATQAYVQVALFGVPENATRTAQRLARMGLPVRISKMNRNGKTFRTVMAGPFGTDDAAKTALSRVRGAGFGDAYLRR